MGIVQDFYQNCNEAKQVIEKQIAENSLENYDKIIELQNNLYTHRKKCFLIPDFAYKFRKKSYQNMEDNIAKELE